MLTNFSRVVSSFIKVIDEEAIKIWLQALKIYQNSNPLKESEILSNITLAYIGLENAPEALSFAQRAVQKSKGTHPDAQSFALYVLGLSIETSPSPHCKLG